MSIRYLFNVFELNLPFAARAHTIQFFESQTNDDSAAYNVLKYQTYQYFFFVNF